MLRVCEYMLGLPVRNLQHHDFLVSIPRCAFQHLGSLLSFKAQVAARNRMDLFESVLVVGRLTRTLLCLLSTQRAIDLECNRWMSSPPLGGRSRHKLAEVPDGDRRPGLGNRIEKASASGDSVK